MYILKRMEWPKEQEKPHIRSVLLLRTEFVTEMPMTTEPALISTSLISTVLSSQTMLMNNFNVVSSCPNKMHGKDNALFTT